MCACGHATDDPAEFNDHLLLMVLPPDGIGADGHRHVPTDPATPLLWSAHRPDTD